MDPLFGALLFIHIAAAIIAFGPGFVFPILGAMGGKEPMHVNFATRVTYAVATRLVLPGAIVVGLTGVTMILVGHLDLFGSFKYLWLAIALYLTALALSVFVAEPTGKKLVEATSAMAAGGPPPGPPAGGPPPGPPPGAPAGGPPPGPPAGGPPAGGPPPHIAALVKRSQRTGMALTGLMLLILLLMIFKPAF